MSERGITMTEQPTSASAKCPKCFSPKGAPHGDHYGICEDYRHPSGAIAGTLAGFYASPEYRAAVLTSEPMAGGPQWPDPRDEVGPDDCDICQTTNGCRCNEDNR